VSLLYLYCICVRILCLSEYILFVFYLCKYIVLWRYIVFVFLLCTYIVFAIYKVQIFNSTERKPVMTNTFFLFDLKIIEPRGFGFFIAILRLYKTRTEKLHLTLKPKAGSSAPFK
jgi:hypothetical protein